MNLIASQQELEEALDACQSSHQGAFSAMHKYPSPEACNPCLQIEGFGLLGLPLSVAEAKRLRDVCNQSPFGKGEQSMVDRTVRDTLEIDGRRIQFLNSLYWNGWLGRAVAKACEQLGVTGQQTRCELYKLLLYETGAQSVHPVSVPVYAAHILHQLSLASRVRSPCSVTSVPVR